MSKPLQNWRNSFRLVSDASGQCKKGQTFRGGTARNASVEFGQSEIGCKDASGKSTIRGGTGKPGPTAVYNSELARKRKIQIRTRSQKAGNSSSGDKFERTFRGYNSHVENGRDGQTIGTHAQLFGHDNGNTTDGIAASGVRGDASDVIYFKSIFERLRLDATIK